MSPQMVKCKLCPYEYPFSQTNRIAEYPEIEGNVWICHECRAKLERKILIREIRKALEDLKTDPA